MSISSYTPETLSQTVQAWADVMPNGKAFIAKNIADTNVFNLLKGFAVEMGRYQSQLFQVASEYIPNFNNGFIDEWESFVGIPDSCFEVIDSTGAAIYDNSERLRNIIIKLVFMNLQTEADYVALGNILGLPISIEVTAAYTMVITITVTNLNSFPFIFPIIFSASNSILFQCIVTKQKEAQTNITFIETT